MSRRELLAVGEVQTLYQSGHTQAEIAEAFGVNQATVCYFMRRHGIAARVAAKRDQKRERNTGWRGDSVGYKAAHQRVYRERGAPLACERCKTTDRRKIFDWANKTGQYHDPADYARLCRSCHRQFDKERRNERTGS